MMTNTERDNAAAPAGRILQGYSMDYTSQKHYARRPDGRWFWRFQSRSPWGYRWGAWRDCGTSTPGEFLTDTGRSARLPK